MRRRKLAGSSCGRFIDIFILYVGFVELMSNVVDGRKSGDGRLRFANSTITQIEFHAFNRLRSDYLGCTG